MSKNASILKDVRHFEYHRRCLTMQIFLKISHTVSIIEDVWQYPRCLRHSTLEDVWYPSRWKDNNVCFKQLALQLAFCLYKSQLELLLEVPATFLTASFFSDLYTLRHWTFCQSPRWNCSWRSCCFPFLSLLAFIHLSSHETVSYTQTQYPRCQTEYTQLCRALQNA